MYSQKFSKVSFRKENLSRGGEKIENFFCSFKSRISGKEKKILERQPVTSRLMTRTRKTAENARTHTRKHTHTHTRVEARHPNNHQLVFQFESLRQNRLENMTMGWLRLVDSLKLSVSFANEPYKRDDILQKRRMIMQIEKLNGI